VSIEQSKALDRALAKAGVSHRLEIVEEKGHGWTGAKLERSITQAIEFLDKILKR
jgi:acetyl esterase/lipase